MLESGWLTISEKTYAFEAAFSGFLGSGAKSLAVANGTAALHMALLACGIGETDEVITPSLTFVADQNVTRMTGAKNVLADITSMEDWSVDHDDIESRITGKTKAVMIVHYGGYACDMERITSICKKHSLFLIEDCAHTPGANYKGQPLGTFGDAAAFSFFANKNIAVGEGGMVVTRNSGLYDKMKLMRSHGMSAQSFDRFLGRAVSYDVTAAGLNYRMTETNSAIGLVQLQKLKEANEKRERLVHHYYSRFDDVSFVSIPYRHFSRGKANYHIMPVLLSDKVDRIKLIELMKQDGIQTSVHYPAISGFSAYKDIVNRAPKAEYVSAHELTLPLYPDMTIEEVDIVCDSLIKNCPSAENCA